MNATRVVATALIAALVTVIAPTHAHADSSVPTLLYPLERVGDTVDVEVMIEAPLKSWGIRRAAKFYDREVDGLTIHTRGTCYQRPQAECVRVNVGTYSDEQKLAISHGLHADWHGITVINETRTIYLNQEYGAYRSVATHELGHALGLDHHGGTEGVMTGILNEPVSPAEIDALRAWYATR